MSEFLHVPVRTVSSSLFGTASEVVYARFKKIKRRDPECQAYIRKVVKSPFFQILMISTVATNAFFMVLGTDYHIRYRLFRLFEGNRYKNLHIADGIQSLRILKVIPYSRGIRTLITAVGQTVYTVASVLTLLFVLMYIFAILGFCLFGVRENGDLNNWGNLAAAFFTLFSLATVDGWTNLQEELDKRKFSVSRTFTIIFILLASFIFLNMFVGVMIMHTEDSIKKFQRELMVERHLTLMEEKQMILKRQQEDVNRLMNTQKSGGKSFIELVEDFKKTLQHTDPMVLDDFGTSLPFIDVYLTTLDNQDTIISKLQELYYEIVNVLSLMLEDLPQQKASRSSEMMI
ncbi:cation channel sperm-associated protein 3 isoform X3 [Meriones unguiculatus]|uniref:cation channel sperm-associated protein 3 isoform X3 n=1 Tax=Meriones unguiculatus TaxID=10047 RepID=UPI00293F5619|nr:cation channel sperm-associated protein 3 isoform X3 [Meriones unguiculatus]